MFWAATNKSLIGNLIYSKKILKALDRHNETIRVVSFDVFDTLLDRVIPSSLITHIAAQNLASLIPTYHSANDISAHRNRSIAAHRQEDREWRLKLWLSDWSQTHSLPEDKVIVWGKEAELQAEKLGLRPTDQAQEILKTITSRNIIPIAVSDMWLEQEWLQLLLADFGLSFQHVFTSVSNHASKKSGDLFPIIQQRLQCRPGSFLHIGDNIYSDVIQPRRAGWRSIWMPQQRHQFPPNIPSEVKRKFNIETDSCHQIVNILKISKPVETSSVFYNMAHNHITPFLILFSYVQWRRFLDQNIEHVFYLARDAKLMLDAYDLTADLFPKSPERHYLKLSRRAVALAHPDNLLQNVIPLAGKVGRDTIGHWMSNFSIDNDLKQKILCKALLTENDLFTQENQALLRKATTYYATSIQAQQEMLRKQLNQYLYQVSNTKKFSRIAIVDTGWAGTIQDTLHQCFPELDLMSGIYLGVSHQGKQSNSNSNKYGILRDDYRRTRHFNPWQATAGVIRIWDTLLRTNEGTTLKLHTGDKGVISPIQENVLDNVTMKHSIPDIRNGLVKGIQHSRNSLKLLIALNDYWKKEDLERAAAILAEPFTTHPSSDTVSHLLNMNVEEGAAQSMTTHLGLKGIKSGTAWYPGLFKNYNVSVLSLLAYPLIYYRIQHMSNNLKH